MPFSSLDASCPQPPSLPDYCVSGTMDGQDIRPEAISPILSGVKYQDKPRQSFWEFRSKKKGGGSVAAVVCPVEGCSKLVLPI